MNHTLSLEAHNTLNKKILRLMDTSVYNTNVNIECPKLEITLPGFSYSVVFEGDKIAPGFIVNLTGCDLEIQSQDCDSNPVALPDGIYVIKYSVSPNDQIYVEYNHLRTTKLLNDYDKILCELDLNACEPNADQAKKLELLRQIKMYIDAAKAKVEICHEAKKGMELYTYAKKLLAKFECKSCY